jgi:hypothetical protein
VARALIHTANETGSLRLPPYPLREAFASPRLAFRTLKRVAISLRHAGARSPFALARTLLRALHLVGRELYKPHEIRLLGLLGTNEPEQTLRRVASRSTMLRVATALNPSACRGNLANKANFYRLASAAGLPTPRVLGLYSPQGGSRWGAQAVSASREEWTRRLLRECPAQFVIKPVVGGWGRAVAVLMREGAERFRAANGVDFDASALLDTMAEIAADSGCLVQERVWNHPALEAFSGSRYLQTLRLYTLVDATGTAQLLRGSLRAIAGSNWVDNTGAATPGNFVAQIDLERGVLLSANVADRRRGGFVALERHPDTAVPIAGFALPHWREACELACALARCFRPLRWVGWDVALAPTGPIAIEGNWNPDAPNNSQRVDWLLAEIRRLF